MEEQNKKPCCISRQAIKTSIAISSGKPSWGQKVSNWKRTDLNDNDQGIKYKLQISIWGWHPLKGDHSNYTT